MKREYVIILSCTIALFRSWGISIDYFMTLWLIGNIIGFVILCMWEYLGEKDQQRQRLAKISEIHQILTEETTK